MQFELRPYQVMAIDASIASPMQRQLIVLSTGLGKTMTALALAKRRAGKTLWLAHSEELVVQPAKAKAVVWPEVSQGIVKAELNQYMRHVVFGSIQSVQQPERLSRLIEQGFSTVVMDEAHHGMSPGYQRVVNALGCFAPGGPTLIGLTATPERSDNAALSDLFQGIVFQMGITSAIEGGYLVPPRIVEHRINVDLDSVTTSGGDFSVGKLDVALMQAGIVSEIVSAYKAHCLEKKTIVFTVSVEQAERVAESLRAIGVRAASVSGETPKDERRAILRRLKSGEIQCIVNCMVLTEGFDEPSIDAVILARPTQSKPLMIQKVGRGLRLFPGKTECLVVDMVGASRKHTLIQAAVLFGVRPDPKEVARRNADDPIADPEAYWQKRLQSQIKGLGGAPRSKLRWIPMAGSDGWLLPTGEHGTVRMVRVGEDWLVDAVDVRVGEQTQMRLADGYVTLETAQAIAEDYVRRVDAVSLSRKSRWRDDPITEAQETILKRSGITTANMTKGTAADLLTQRSAEPATQKQIAYLKRFRNIPDNITKREAMRMIAQMKGASRG